MHKYWKRPATLTVIVLLVFMMTLPLTACQIEIPGIGTVNIKDSDLPNNGGNMSGDDGGDDVDGVNTEGGYDDSLDLLRKEMDAPSYMFAAAYICSAAGGSDDFEFPMRDWVNEAAPELCAKYPFLRDIPRERVVGSGGSLFCVVPRDPDATVVVNRIRWSEAKGNYETIKELYHSQNGEPILLFVSYDLEKTPFETTELRLTDRYGDTLSWLPTAGSLSLPYDYENDKNLAFDFTFYSQEGNDENDGSDFGWTCPDSSQLTQKLWVWRGEADKPAIATLELNANSSQENDWGSATFTWWYESDFVTPEEVYTGDWSLSANGEYSGVLTLDMTRTGGKRYKPGETERLIHDSFIVQVPMLFEDYNCLAVDKGTHGSYLPVQMEPETVLYFYPQWTE